MKQYIKTVTIRTAVAVLFTSLAFTSFSQTSKFSISINSLTTNFNYGKSNSLLDHYKKNFRGLQAGVSYQAGISSDFSIVPELYFAMKGGILKENNPLTVNKSTLRLYSVDMPILARVHCNKLYVNAGPYLSYNLGGRLKTEGSESLAGSTTKISFGNGSGDFKRWDVGASAGAGYNFSLKQTTLTLDVRYSYGLVNISQDIERYNRVFNISLIVTKPEKKKKTEKQG